MSFKKTNVASFSRSGYFSAHFINIRQACLGVTLSRAVDIKLFTLISIYLDQNYVIYVAAEIRQTNYRINFASFGLMYSTKSIVVLKPWLEGNKRQKKAATANHFICDLPIT